MQLVLQGNKLQPKLAMKAFTFKQRLTIVLFPIGDNFWVKRNSCAIIYCARVSAFQATETKKEELMEADVLEVVENVHGQHNFSFIVMFKKSNLPKIE